MGVIIYAKSTPLPKLMLQSKLTLMVNFSSTRVYPDVAFDSESSKENQLDIHYLSRNDCKQMNEWV